MQIEDVYALVAEDRRAVDELIQRRLHSEVELINQIGHYIVNSGGKRLRPVITLLSAGALRYSGKDHYELAAIVEFIHTATLLHDDVVDASELRRGNQTANAVWGNEASVLVGDFLYSRAFEMMVAVGEMRVMEIMAEATRTIAEGEVLQLLNVGNAAATEEEYLNVIRCKTAKLFEAAGKLGAVIAGGDEATIQAMAGYGMHLGIAYQLVDDVLDYSAASSEELGKNIGDDLAEGKPTLPLIYTIEHGSAEQSAIVRNAIENGGKDQIEAVKEAIETTGAIAYTSRSAKREAETAIAALGSLADSPHKQAMEALARFAIERTY